MLACLPGNRLHSSKILSSALAEKVPQLDSYPLSLLRDCEHDPPLAWLVPTLDIQTPFILVVPNKSVSEAYWQRAKILTASRRGKSFVNLEIWSQNSASPTLKPG